MTHFRQLYSKIISDKHDDIMAKFGAILAQGILDAGEQNHLHEYYFLGFKYSDQPWFSVFKHSMDHEEGV